ncbi:MAG TPA: EFR1 family ferrodoxin, partial [Spirochaetota bacterium]
MFKKVRIHYFTGTGNSLSAATTLSSSLTKKGSSVTLINIEKEKNSPSGKSDLDIFVFPVLAYSVPHIVQTYMKSFAKRKDAPKAAVLMTGGGWTGRANAQADRILARRGFDVIVSDFVSYPNNWSQMSPTPDAKESAKIIKSAPKTITAFVSSLIKEKRSHFRVSPFNSLWTTVVGFSFLNIGRQFLGYGFTAD